MRKNKKRKPEYGEVRIFVIQHAKFIAEELGKGRCVSSIWKEVRDNTCIDIKYDSFLYNVGNIVTKNRSVEFYNEKEETNKKNTEMTKFKFSAKANNKDEII